MNSVEDDTESVSGVGASMSDALPEIAAAIIGGSGAVQWDCQIPPGDHLPWELSQDLRLKTWIYLCEGTIQTQALKRFVSSQTACAPSSGQQAAHREDFAISASSNCDCDEVASADGC